MFIIRTHESLSKQQQSLLQKPININWRLLLDCGLHDKTEVVLAGALSRHRHSCIECHAVSRATATCRKNPPCLCAVWCGGTRPRSRCAEQLCKVSARRGVRGCGAVRRSLTQICREFAVRLLGCCCVRAAVLRWTGGGAGADCTVRQQPIAALHCLHTARCAAPTLPARRPTPGPCNTPPAPQYSAILHIARHCDPAVQIT